ncbi:prepilin-type N-terminal cleavage/methylation domain-containing protein [Candidatus Uabimicrobium sp. HlEnr_7]|uniref:prepilin-type N-terminal cleavage/methylation domain-containing protein n=1 Tax=Candidatus Uabimicrobium helgolandensis TaxID=3095367 RepID=UPI00355770D2
MKRKNSGFTLIEILIAIGILIVGLGGVLVLFPAGLHSTKKAVEETQSTLIAESVHSSFMSSMQILNSEPLNTSKGKFKFFYDGIDSGLSFILPVEVNGDDEAIFDSDGGMKPLGFETADTSDDSTFIPGIRDANAVCNLGTGFVAESVPTLPYNITVSDEDNHLSQYSFSLEIQSPTLEKQTPLTLFDIIIRIFRAGKLIYRAKTQVFVSPPPGNPGS